jgi:hypothetical protein
MKYKKREEREKKRVETLVLLTSYLRQCASMVSNMQKLRLQKMLCFNTENQWQTLKSFRFFFYLHFKTIHMEDKATFQSW